VPIIINRKERKELRKERKVLNIRNFLFATFAKIFATFAVKNFSIINQIFKNEKTFTS
jgi:hypothetical protein